MINVSSAFKNAMKAPVKVVRATVAIDGGSTYASDDVLMKLELKASGYYFGVATKAITIKLLGTDYNLLSKACNVMLGVQTSATDDTWEDCELGRFRIVEQLVDLEKGVTTLEAYDAIGVMALKNYVPGELDFPTTINNLAVRVAADNNMGYTEQELTNGTYQIPEDLYANINGITYRDILAEIAGATASLAAVHGVGSDLTFTTPIMEPVDALGYENLKKIKLEPKYGKVSSVVIARTPQEDNIAVVDDAVTKIPSGKNLFDINNIGSDTGTANMSYVIKDGSLTLTATGTVGAQYARYYVDGLESEKTYTFSFKAKKTVMGTAGSSVIRIFFYGTNDGVNYTTIGATGNAPTQGEEYFFTRTLSGYSKYRFYIYNNASTPVTVGEQTVYSELQLEPGSQATPYEEFRANGIVEVKLANNEILDDNREAMATPILDAIKGFEFHPFEATTEGHGWHEVGDRINIFAEPYLPEAYQQVEYIENQGGQYIDTGVKACMNNIRCVCDMAAMSDADSAFFGSRGSYYLFYNFANNYFWPISMANTRQGTLVVGNKYHVDWNKGVFTVTGEDGVYQNATRSNATQDTQNMYIFNFNPRDGRQSLSRIYYFKIYNNDVLVRDFVPCYRKADGVAGLYDKKNGVFYPSAGDGNFAVGADASNGESVAEVIVTGVELTIDGGIKEIIKGVAPDETTTNYALAGGITKTIYNTEIKVDKQGQEITSVVSRQDSFENETLENFSQITQNISSVVTTIQTTGGSNMLRNSVGYNIDTDGNLVNWAKTGTITAESSPESVSYGALSGNQISLAASSSITQRVTVSPDLLYTLSFRVKKNVSGTATIRLTNGTDNYSLTIPANESQLWKDFSIVGVKPSESYFDVIISTDSSITLFAITDLMLATGDSVVPWVSAADEILSKQVAIDQNGVKVSSSTNDDYVQLDEYGLNGYHNGDNVLTLQQDVTEVAKLKAREQITMPPIKIVPVTTGNNQGWSFVATEE